MRAQARVMAAVREPGFHRWPDAPNEVGFLRSEHRHVFTVRGEWPVGGDDREVEFFIAQGWLRDALEAQFERDHHGYDFGSRSCEHIARALLEGWHAGYPRPSAIEVWEDDENGSRVEAVLP